MKLLQIHPTMQCNRRCSFCSYRDTPSAQALSFHRIIEHLIAGRQQGANELKITGGGEPLLHKDITGILHLAKGLNYYVYLQTNGILLTERIRDLVMDIRISYGDGITFEPPQVRPDGFSYIVTAKPDYANLNSVIRYAIANDMYVRVTQDDTASFDDIPDIDEVKRHVVESNNVKYWDVKNYHQGANPCISSIESPLIGADGYIYPCCRTQYAQDDVVLGYNKDMRMVERTGIAFGGNGADTRSVTVEALAERHCHRQRAPSPVGLQCASRNLNKIKPFNGSKCTRCYYGANNTA